MCGYGKRKWLGIARPGRTLASSLLLVASVVSLAGCGRTALEYLEAARKADSAAEQELLLNRALEKDPGLMAARFQRAKLCAAVGKHDQAIADFNLLLESAQSAQQKASIYYWRGWAMDRRGETEKAVEDYSAALRLDPGFIDPYVSRAAAHFRLGKYAESMQDYLSMLEQDISGGMPGAAERRAEWRLRRAFAAFCAGEWASASGDFKLAIDNTRSRVQEARAILNLYFVACKMRDDHTDADAVLKTYAEGIRSVSRRPPWIFHAVWFVAGMETKEELLEASKHKSPEVQADQMMGAWYYIGARHLVNGDVEKAREAFRKCIETEDLGSFEYHMARVELERLDAGGKTAGDYVAMAQKVSAQQRRIELYTKALEVDPNHTGARLNRALLYSLAGMHDLAIDDYSRLLNIYQSPANRARALRYRGSTYAQKGDYEAAASDYAAAAEADPELWEAREGLAVALCHLRKYKEAAAVYTGLIKQITGAGMQNLWLLQRALALFCAGDLTGAAGDLEAVLERGGDEPLIRANRFIIECKLGNRPTATKELLAFAEKIKIVGWESSVAWHLAEMRTADELLAISKHSDKAEEILRTSRAYYYIGALRLIKGHKDEARQAFQDCVRLGRESNRESWEYRMALVELAR